MIDGYSYDGRVYMGTGINNDSLEIAIEVIVCLVVSVNENWKLPVGEDNIINSYIKMTYAYDFDDLDMYLIDLLQIISVLIIHTHYLLSSLNCLTQ